MIGPSNDPSRLFKLLPIPEARVLQSTFLLVVLVFVVWVLWKSAPRLKRRIPPRVVDVIFLVVSGAIALFIGQRALSLWASAAPNAPNVDIFGQLTGFRIAVTVGVVVAAYIGSGMLVRAVDRFTSETGQLTGHQGEVLSRLTEVAVYLLAALLLLSVWQVDVRAFLIGAGFLGIIIGLAANETLSALIAGFTLMFSRPFEIGDWIEVPLENGEDTDGIVTDITLFSTRIETFSGKYVVLPNDLVSSNTLVNYGRKGTTQVGGGSRYRLRHRPPACHRRGETDDVGVGRSAERSPTGRRADRVRRLRGPPRTPLLDRPAQQSPSLACDDGDNYGGEARLRPGGNQDTVPPAGSRRARRNRRVPRRYGPKGAPGWARQAGPSGLPRPAGRR